MTLQCTINIKVKTILSIEVSNTKIIGRPVIGQSRHWIVRLKLKKVKLL